MRIRWKLFWLLAAISLAPLLLLRLNSQRSLSHLAELVSRFGSGDLTVRASGESFVI